MSGAFTVLLLLLTGGSAQIRELDFPPVDLTQKDSGLTVRFRHPSLFYRELQTADEAVVKFTVSSDVGDFEQNCTAQKDDCRLDVWFPDGVSRCVRLHGRDVSEGMFTLRETRRICLSVPTPTNVKLSCRNVNVSVSWESREPQTRFRVHIGGSAGHHVNETTEHGFDLSAFVWASEQRFLGLHYVTVTAVDGGNQSESVISQTFTFNQLKEAQIKCELDFPAVEVFQKDWGATVSFRNPLLFYRELKQVDKPQSVRVTVSTDAGEVEEVCTARQDICRCDISFPRDVKKCVNLTGSLGVGVGQVSFRRSGPVCAGTDTEADALTLTIMIFVLVIVVGVLIILICKVRAWTTKDTPDLPKPLTSPLPRHDLIYAPVSIEDCSAVTVTAKICKNPSVSPEEEEEEEEEDKQKKSSSAPYDSRPPAGDYREGRLSEGYGREDDSADDSLKTETVSTDLEEEEEEEEASPYDRPHGLQVDMGDGDMVTGYSER